MKTEQEIRSYLPNFHGSETFTKWGPLFPKDVLTEGTLWLAGATEGFWLMDAIASHQLNSRVKFEDFQVWTLTVYPEHTADLDASDGNDTVIAQQAIEYTDFPLETIRLFACRNELDGITIMLPSEY